MGQNEWYDLEYQGAKAKAPPCSSSTPLTPLPQQSSSSASEEDDHWEVMEERRRRRIAFENLAKGMLRYLDNCNEVNVGITELQERLEVPAQIGISIQHVAQQTMHEDDQQIFEVFWQEEGELFVASWARWEAQRKGLVDLERRCQDISREIQMLNKRQEIFRNVIECKLRVQDRASERMQNQIIEAMKELVHKDRRSLAVSGEGARLVDVPKRKRSNKKCRASGNRGRMRKWLGHHQEKGRNGQAGKRQQRLCQASGGWNLKGQRRCRKSLSCRMRWKVLS